MTFTARLRRSLVALFACALALPLLALSAVLPDGRSVTPAGFTIPVESFASAAVLSPDGRWLAVLSVDAGAIDLIATDRSVLADRLAVPSASALAWTADGLYVARGYTGTIARYAYDAKASKAAPVLSKRLDVQVGASGLLYGIAEDPATHRLAVARTAERSVVVLDDETGATLATLPASGQPFDVAFAGEALIAANYDGDRVDLWRGGAGPAIPIVTGPHPTRLLVDGTTVYVADADGHDVAAIDTATASVTRRFDLRVAADAPPGQTPSGMALSGDRATLFVAESGYNDIAIVELASGRVRGRIPTAWYPTAVIAVDRPVGSKDPRVRHQLWVTSAKGFGSQPDPGGEWNGTYTGLVQHLVVDDGRIPAWSTTVAHNDRLAGSAQPHASLPPVKHVVFIVRENKHFDEEFADEPHADGDPALLLYGRRFTPNAHALAERFTLFDNFMSDGEASIYGHAWTTQGMANDYHERNAHLKDPAETGARVAWSIWPYPLGGEDTLAPADMDFDWYRDLSALGRAPRVNVSGVFGPRGELVDELQRKHIGFRVYGEQLTMRPDGRIAPGLAEHAARDYPGDHIDFGVLDTDRAKLFLDDVAAHGLAQYSYLTLPDDHTAGSKAGFYTPASYVANNDAALGTIVAGLSHRRDWSSTVVLVTCDDAQGTGDHVDSHRMPAFALGPFVRRGYVDHTRYSQSSILRTVEVLFGLPPLNVYDAAATPMLDAFARQPSASTYAALGMNVPMERNPGRAVSLSLELDGPDAAAIADDEWRSLRGSVSLAAHRRYLQQFDPAQLADDDSGR